VVLVLALVLVEVLVVVVLLQHSLEVKVVVEVVEYFQVLEELVVLIADQVDLVALEEMLVLMHLMLEETWVEAEEAEAGELLVVKDGIQPQVHGREVQVVRL
jgi:hypothetical protein